MMLDRLVSHVKQVVTATRLKQWTTIRKTNLPVTLVLYKASLWLDGKLVEYSNPTNQCILSSTVS